MEVKEQKILYEISEIIENIPMQDQTNKSILLNEKENTTSQVCLTAYNHESSDLQLSEGEEEEGNATQLKESVKNDESEIDDAILEVAGKYIHNICKTGSYLSGYIDGKEELDEFLSEFRVVCKNSFPIRDSHQWCKEKDQSSFQKSKLLWSLSSGVMPVPSFNMPFCVEGYVIRDCFNGVMPVKRKTKVEEKTAPTDAKCVRRRRKSGKLGCKASMKIKHVTVFPEFKVDPSSVFSAKGLRKLKANELKRLRYSLKTEENVNYISRFCIEVPLSIAHSHSSNSATGYTRLHPIIIQKIQELVYTGFRDISAIKEQLILFVQTELFKNSGVSPGITDRSYYPLDRDIRNHLRNTMKKMEDISRKQKALIGELQSIASWVCQCSDLNQLDFISNKITEIRKTYNLNVLMNPENTTDNTPEYNDVCSAEDVTYIQTIVSSDCNDEQNTDYEPQTNNQVIGLNVQVMIE